MTVAEQAVTSPSLAERLRTEVQTFTQEYRRALQITGLVAVAGVTGAAGGLLVAKGIAAGKGLTTVPLALTSKGVAATAASKTSLPALLTAQTTGAAGSATTSALPTVASVQNLASALNRSATNGVALVDKATAFWHTLSSNALPLTAGVVGGGAAGVGVTQRSARKTQDQLATQLARTESLQAETAQLHQTLATTEAQLQSVQTQLAAQPIAPTAPPITIPPKERLERIHGIGRVFAQRLHAAGIYTLTDLAAQTPETIEAILDRTRAGAMFDPAAWIAEAQQLIGNQQPIDREQRVDERTDHVDAAVISTTQQSATEQELVTFALERLEALDGISPATAAHLNQLGILTYADLAEQDAERLIALLNGNPPHTQAEVAAWIAAAQSSIGIEKK